MENNTTHTGGETIGLSAPDNRYTFSPTPVGDGNNEFGQYWGVLNWDLGPLMLTYQPAYRTWQSDAIIHAQLGPLAFTQTVNTPKDNFLTQELRLASAPGSKITWQVGDLYYDNELSNLDAVQLVPSGIYAFTSRTAKKTTRASGIFGDATYPFATSWRLTAGLRYDYTKVAVNQDRTSITGITQSLGGADGTRRFNNTTYNVRLEHDLTEANMLYASVSTGFSPGDTTVTTGITGNPIALILKAETLTAYELGSKNRFLDDTLQVNGAVYYYDYAGYQTAAINVTPANVGTPTFAILASPAQAYGGEEEVLSQLTPNDRVGLNLSYTNAYLDKSGTLVATGGGTDVTFADFFARDKISGVVEFPGFCGHRIKSANRSRGWAKCPSQRQLGRFDMPMNLSKRIGINTTCGRCAAC